MIRDQADNVVIPNNPIYLEVFLQPEADWILKSLCLHLMQIQFLNSQWVDKFLLLLMQPPKKEL